MSAPVFYPVESTTLPIDFDTFDGGTGASITMTGLAVTDVEIYAGTSMTQRASDNGITLLDTDGIDLDGITGIQGFSIDLSDNSDAGFYVVGTWYRVVISSITIDGQTVNFTAARFRIVSATRGLAGTALPNAAADAAGGLPISDAGGLDLDAKLATATSALATAASLATAQSDLDTLTGTDGATLATSQPNYAPATAAALATAQLDLDTITGADGVELSTQAKADVNAEVDTALSDYDPPTKAEMDTGLQNLGFEDGFVYFDPENGNDSNPGTISSPKQSAHLAYAASTNKKIKCLPNGVPNSNFMQYLTGTMSDLTLDLNGRAIDKANNSEAFGTGADCYVFSSGAQGHLYGGYDPSAPTSPLMIDLGTGNHFENILIENAKFSYAYLVNCSVKAALKVVAGGGVNILTGIYFTDNNGSDAELWLGSADTNKVTEITDFWGNFEVRGLKSTQRLYALGWGQVTLNADCTGGTIFYSSHVDIVDNSGGAVTKTLYTEGTQEACAAALTAYDPPTRAELTSDKDEILTIIGTPADTDVSTDIANLPQDNTGCTLADSEDVYHADIDLTIDEANSQDEYTVTFFRNGVRQTTGITTPLIQVVKRADGTDLIASTALTQIATTGSYKLDATTTSRITNGEAVLVIVTGTINSAARTFSRLLGRDASS